MIDKTKQFSYKKGYNLDHESLARRFVLRIREGRFRRSLQVWLRYYFYLYPLFRIYHALLSRYFYVSETRYKYLIHVFNATDTERVVEIPFAYSFYKNNTHKDFLEIGNVISTYYKIEGDRDIIDKYEIGDKIINEDIATFKPHKKYDLIMSVSTIEHVGWDEKPREYGKTAKAIRNVETMLKPGGKLLITFPLRQNPEVDKLLVNGLKEFKNKYFLKRTSYLNNWTETDLSKAIKCGYSSRYPAANAVAFIIYERK